MCQLRCDSCAAAGGAYTGTDFSFLVCSAADDSQVMARRHPIGRQAGFYYPLFVCVKGGNHAGQKCRQMRALVLRVSHPRRWSLLRRALAELVGSASSGARGGGPSAGISVARQARSVHYPLHSPDAYLPFIRRGEDRAHTLTKCTEHQADNKQY